ncbi:MAG TPA: HEAT repeat domain-containing protein, partial [Armatimonadota bacterium]|nr:HEAT repeat domain-containing protein [Armatimonadota bacterium]
MAAEVSRLARRGAPTSVGRYLLALSDRELRALLKLPTFGGAVIVAFFLDHAPERLRPHVDGLLRSRDAYKAGAIADLLLRKAPARYEAQVAAAFDLTNSARAFLIGQHLVEYDAATYGRMVLEAARKQLDHTTIPWVLQHYGVAVVDELVAYFRTRNRSAWVETSVLHACASAFGRAGIPVYLQAMRNNEEATRLTALGCLAAHDDGSQAALLTRELGLALQRCSGQTLATIIEYVIRWNPAAFEDALWKLTGNSSRPVRDAATRALGALGARIEPQAVALLGQKKAETRRVAVTLLARLGTPGARAALEARLDEEEQEEIRDAIFAGLQPAWAAEGNTLARVQVEERILRGAGKLRWPPASWLATPQLPPLYYADGDEVPAEGVRFLLSRQASTKAITPSLEVQPLYALLDRERSASFAAAIYRAFIAAGADAKDRWALTVAGMLGDDRLAAEITAQIHRWAESSRGKLAEWAVQALALMGTDGALMLVDALAMRYRVKMKNIGAAAVDAFADAARARGITPDELGERVVPWLHQVRALAGRPP